MNKFGSLWQRFLEVINTFSVWYCICPWNQGWPFFWTNLNPNALCQSWLKLTQCFWKRFPKVIYVFSLFFSYLPLEQKITIYHDFCVNNTINGLFVCLFVWFHVLPKIKQMVLNKLNKLSYTNVSWSIYVTNQK